MEKKDYLQKAIELANEAFFGSTVTLERDQGTVMLSSNDIREAIRYVTLDEQSKAVWDDPNMTKAQKYQNIPQADISTYRGDYIDHPPIKLNEDGSIEVYAVFSARGKSFLSRFDEDTSDFNKFYGMSKLAIPHALLEHGAIVRIQQNNIILREDSITHVIVDEAPHYNVRVDELSLLFKDSPRNCYVPYRRGWSRLLNIQEVPAPEMACYLRNVGGPCFAIIPSDGIMSVWDGRSMKVESHGVEAERMQNITAVYFYNGDFSKEASATVKMRMLSGTHEHMEDVTVDIVPNDNIHMKFYQVWALKGINIEGYEFNMS